MRFPLIFPCILALTAACDDQPTIQAADEQAPVGSQAMGESPSVEPGRGAVDTMQAGSATSDRSGSRAAGNPGVATEATNPAKADAGGPRVDWVAGDYPPNLNSNKYLTITGITGQPGKTRGYKVHVPKGYDPRVPAPVLFAFHGYQQNAVMFGINGTSFVAKSDKEGFILVMPNGIQEDGFGGSWNAGVCCGAASSQRLDDVGFVRAIHAELRTHLNVDEGRIYATGLSNGGFMTHRLGCEAADLFAAIAPLAGSIGTKELGAIGTNSDPDLKTCAPTKPIAVLALHGNGDPIVPYAGMKPSLDLWARANGCSETTRPAVTPASGGDTTCVTYEGCTGGVEVTGCTVDKGGHCWFGDPGCGTGAPGIGNLFVGNNSKSLNASDAVWDFVSRFRR